jgi:hypothetical protein
LSRLPFTKQFVLPSQTELTNPLRITIHNLKIRKMKKYLILPLAFILLPIAFCLATPLLNQKDTLTAYTGRYETSQGDKIVQVDVDIQNGELVGTSLRDGQQLHLDRSSGNYIIKESGLFIKFIKDKKNVVTGILVSGTDVWKKTSATLAPIGAKPGNQDEYVGKYQTGPNNQPLIIEIAVKHGKLWGTQLWDGRNSPLDYVSGDEFTINNLGFPLKFIRDNDKKVVNILFNGTDTFIKIK